MALTFLAVVVAWVFFRASTFHGARLMLEGMVGLHGVSLPAMVASRLGPWADTLAAHGVEFSSGGGRDFVLQWLWIVALLPVVFLAPNTQQILAGHPPALEAGAPARPRWLVWKPSGAWAWGVAVVLACGLLSLTRPSEFLYFQF